MAGTKLGLLGRDGADSRGAYELIPNTVTTSVNSQRTPSSVTSSIQRTSSERLQRIVQKTSVNGKSGSVSKDPLSPSNRRRSRPGCPKKHLRFETETPLQKWAREKLEGNCIQYVTVAVIVFNAVCFGFETDMPALFHWDLMETLFLIFFTCELVWRLFAYRMHFFDCMGNNDFSWNIIDLCIVLTSLSSIFLKLLMPKASGMSSNATLFRTVRLLRILRILRVVRVFRFLKQLYLLAYGFIEGANAVFWVATLACAANYVCSVILVRLYRDEDNGVLRDKFRNIPTSMFTLFEILSDPDIDSFRTDMNEYPCLIGFIVFYIIFGSFGINGLLTGVISESVLEQNQARLDSQRMDREQKRKKLRIEAEVLYDQMLEEDDGHLTPEDILDFETEIRELFKRAAIVVPDYDVHRMLEVMDYDGNGEIDKGEFVNGMLQICEEVRPVSIMELHCDIHRCHGKIRKCNKNVERIISNLALLTHDVHKYHSAVTQGNEFITDSFPSAAGADEHRRTPGRAKTAGLATHHAKTDVPARDRVKTMVDTAVETDVPSSIEHAAPQRTPLLNDGLKMNAGQGPSDPVHHDLSSNVASEAPHPARTTKKWTLPPDCSEVQSWHLHLLQAYKDGADELLRKISEMKLPSTSSESVSSSLDDNDDALYGFVEETYPSARMQKKEAGEALAAKPPSQETGVKAVKTDASALQPLPIEKRQTSSDTSAENELHSSQKLSGAVASPTAASPIAPQEKGEDNGNARRAESRQRSPLAHPEPSSLACDSDSQAEAVSIVAEGSLQPQGDIPKMSMAALAETYAYSETQPSDAHVILAREGTTNCSLEHVAG